MEKFLRKMAALLPMILLCTFYMGGAQAATADVSQASGGVTKTQDSVKPIQFIMHYDIDDGASLNDRPDNGWYPLNPNPPADDTGIYRSTTPLLGTYDSSDPTVQMQHLYWLSALGCSGVQCDLSNVSPVVPGMEFHSWHYCSGVINAYSVFLNTISKVTKFKAPKAYPAIRLNGGKYSDLQLLLDNMYSLYKSNQGSWYKLDDGSPDKDKPFIVIFADWSLLQRWATVGKVPFTDSRFNIRWTNGELEAQKGVTSPDANGNLVVKKGMPYWLFIENKPTPGKDGYYIPVYTQNALTGLPEQMTTWAAVWLNGTNWDGLLNQKNGKYTIERCTEPVYSIRPQTLLIGRFNYPLAWIQQPQEGVSLNNSVHIEPNVDWGFKVFNLVANQTYSLNAWAENAPPAPNVQSFDKAANVLKISIDGNPLEYRISTNKNFTDAQWTYFNINTSGIPMPDGVSGSKTVYIQTRNSFGTSDVAVYSKGTGSSSDSVRSVGIMKASGSAGEAENTNPDTGGAAPMYGLAAIFVVSVAAAVLTRKKSNK